MIHNIFFLSFLCTLNPYPFFHPLYFILFIQFPSSLTQCMNFLLFFCPSLLSTADSFLRSYASYSHFTFNEIRGLNFFFCNFFLFLVCFLLAYQLPFFLLLCHCFGNNFMCCLLVCFFIQHVNTFFLEQIFSVRLRDGSVL